MVCLPPQPSSATTVPPPPRNTLQVASLVPPELDGAGVSVDEYMARLAEFDSSMAEQAESAAAAGEVVRYVGVVDMPGRKASVTLHR